MKPSPIGTRIATFRKHWLPMAIEAVVLIFLAFVPFFAWEAISSWMGGRVGPQFDSIATAVSLVWALVLWIGFFMSWTNWALDIWVLTETQLMDVEQLGLFSRKISTLDLRRIQDITIETHGFLDTILRTGTITVQTAGTDANFILPNIHHPEWAKETILAAVRAQQAMDVGL